MLLKFIECKIKKRKCYEMNYYEMIDTIEETLDKHSSEINEVFENQSFHFNFVVRDCPKIRIDRIKEYKKHGKSRKAVFL